MTVSGSIYAHVVRFETASVRGTVVVHASTKLNRSETLQRAREQAARESGATADGLWTIVAIRKL